MSDWADELETTEAPLAKTEPRELIKQLENELLAESLSIVADANAAREINVIQVNDKDIPPAWVQKLGLERARAKYRTAFAASMSSKEAPVYLKMARDTSVGIIKARATESAGPRVMNATLIQINPDPRVTPGVQPREYPRILEQDDK